MSPFRIRGRAGCYTTIFLFQFSIIFACLVYIAVYLDGRPKKSPEDITETPTTVNLNCTTTETGPPSSSQSSTGTTFYATSEPWSPTQDHLTSILPTISSTPTDSDWENCDNATVDDCPPVCPEVDDPNGSPTYFPYPIDSCQQYYVCANGRPVCFKCSHNLVWDQLNLTCVHPEDFICSFTSPSLCLTTMTTIGSTTETGVTKDPISWVCPAPYRGLKRHPFNCSLYYLCDPGQTARLLDCPQNLYFNPDMCYCDWQENVKDCFAGVPNEESMEKGCVLPNLSNLTFKVTKNLSQEKRFDTKWSED